MQKAIDRNLASNCSMSICNSLITPVSQKKFGQFIHIHFKVEDMAEPLAFVATWRLLPTRKTKNSIQQCFWIFHHCKTYIPEANFNRLFHLFTNRTSGLNSL